MTVAGARIKGKLPKGLNYGHPLSKGTVNYDARIFSDVSGIVKNQINVLAELTALANWYKQVRINCVAQTHEQKFLYESGLRMVELNYQERLDQLSRYVDSLENSVRLLEGMQTSKKEISEQKDLLSRWPKLGSEFKNLEKFETQIPKSLKEELENMQSQGQSDYTGLIKNLSQSGKQSGKTWLSEIAGIVRNVYTAGINKSG